MGFILQVNLRQHRTIASASLRRLFAPLLQFEKREIHTGFLRFPNLGLGQKSCLRLLAELRGAAFNLFAACGRETLRGFLSRWKARVKLACTFVYWEFENHRYLPVILLSQFRISAGVPAATICPPASPPPGPISIT